MADFLCNMCGEPYEPQWLEAIKRWSRVCPQCGFANLARVIWEDVPEAELPEDIKRLFKQQTKKEGNEQ